MKYKKGNQKEKLVNSEVVRIKDNRRKDLLLIITFVFSIAILVLFYVWQRIENVELAYRIDDLKAEYMKQKEINNELTMQMEKLESLGRIKEIAENQFGMSPPKEGEMLLARPVIVVLDPDSSALAGRQKEKSKNKD